MPAPARQRRPFLAARLFVGLQVASHAVIHPRIVPQASRAKAACAKAGAMRGPPAQRTPSVPPISVLTACAVTKPAAGSAVRVRWPAAAANAGSFLRGKWRIRVNAAPCPPAPVAAMALAMDKASVRFIRKERSAQKPHVLRAKPRQRRFATAPVPAWLVPRRLATLTCVGVRPRACNVVQATLVAQAQTSVFLVHVAHFRSSTFRGSPPHP